MIKTHYKTDDTNIAACNKNKNQKKLTFKPSEVTCESCKATNIWKDDMSIEESKRDASGGELGYEVLSYDYDKSIDKCSTTCEYQETFIVGSNKCEKKCDYFISDDSKKQQVKCSFKAKNKPKTQLELDKEKYSLSDEHVEILSKVDYEVVFDQLDECDCCLLNKSNDCSCISCDHIIFKQINKKEEPLNIQKWLTRDNGDIEIVNVSHDEVLKINEWLRKEKLTNQFVSHDKNIVIRFILKAKEDEFKKFMLTLEEKKPKTWIEKAVDKNKDKISECFDETLKKIIDDLPQEKINIKIAPPKYNPDDVAFKKGIPGFKKTLDDMYSTMLAKNSDYAGEKGAFDNFLMVDKLGITSPEKGILVRMTDKLCRISNLLENDAKVKDEAITDTLLDLANYSVILKCLIESKNKDLEV